MIRVVFAGTPAFSLPSLMGLIGASHVEVAGVVSQPDRRSGRGMKLSPSPIKQAAVEQGIEVITPNTLRGNDEALAWLRGKQADVLVVLAFGMILPKTWLDAPAHGAVNVHASLLPRWRGAAPIERAILAGDDETGVCMMSMDEGLDTGGVYARASVPIGRNTTSGGLRETLASLGAEQLLLTLPGIVDVSIVAVPQNDEMATYASKLCNSERCIDWAQSAVQVDRVVRAFAPTPAARTRLHGKWVKVLEGEAVGGTPADAAGVINMAGGHFDVCCSEGSYRIHRLQPEGKKAMSAGDFKRGMQASMLDRFEAPDELGR
ncbi:MAG: methionyl-tRNA formyltransferase [Mariprofundaceae bacterium]